jgi:hypothetical protein
MKLLLVLGLGRGSFHRVFNMRKCTNRFLGVLFAAYALYICYMQALSDPSQEAEELKIYFPTAEQNTRPRTCDIRCIARQ